MKTIKEILMGRDGLSENEAVLIIGVAQERLQEYLDDGDLDSAGNICEEFFNLEPDYLMELL